MSWQQSRGERRPLTPIQKAVIPAVGPTVTAPKPAAPAEPNLLMRYLGKRVVVKLVFDGTVTGTLHSFTKYELVIVEGDGSQTIVLKGAIASVAEARP